MTEHPDVIFARQCEMQDAVDIARASLNAAIAESNVRHAGTIALCRPELMAPRAAYEAALDRLIAFIDDARGPQDGPSEELGFVTQAGGIAGWTVGD